VNQSDFLIFNCFSN